MNLNLRLKAPPVPRISVSLLAGATRSLQEITARNLVKTAPGGESRQLKNRRELMKRRLIKEGGAVLFEAGDEVGWQRILLSLYLEYAARPDATWLLAFDESVAGFVLGADGREWHAARRRQVTQLFFTHFDQLPLGGLSRLCSLLIESYGSMDSEGQGPVVQWRRHRALLFNPAGHSTIARSADVNESLASLISRFAVPNDGRFAESLRQVVLFNFVRDSPFGKEIPALTEIELLKTERASASLLLGAAALQIIIQRVAGEGNRKWQGDWPQWITRLGCDPRYSRATGEGTKWWGWATDDEIRMAQQGVTGLTLRFFIEFLQQSLQGTSRESQFTMRSRFLLGLYEAGKIQSARLALNWAAYQRLDPKYHDPWNVAHLTATTDETSMICLKCVDDIFVIEGTHTFGLRVFRRKFPIRGFWEKPEPIYQDWELRISPADCPVFLRHDQSGNWVDNFFKKLSTKFHIEWDDVNI